MIDEIQLIVLFHRKTIQLQRGFHEHPRKFSKELFFCPMAQPSVAFKSFRIPTTPPLNGGVIRHVWVGGKSTWQGSSERS